HRLPELQSAVLNGRDLAVRVDGQIFGSLRAAIGEMDRHVLVVELELVCHPQDAEGARHRNAVDFQSAHFFLPVRPVYHNLRSSKRIASSTSCMASMDGGFRL